MKLCNELIFLLWIIPNQITRFEFNYLNYIVLLSQALKLDKYSNPNINIYFHEIKVKQFWSFSFEFIEKLKNFFLTLKVWKLLPAKSLEFLVFFIELVIFLILVEIIWHFKILLEVIICSHDDSFGFKNIEHKPCSHLNGLSFESDCFQAWRILYQIIQIVMVQRYPIIWLIYKFYHQIFQSWKFHLTKKAK